MKIEQVRSIIEGGVVARPPACLLLVCKEQSAGLASAVSWCRGTTGTASACGLYGIGHGRPAPLKLNGNKNTASHCLHDENDRLNEFNFQIW